MLKEYLETPSIFSWTHIPGKGTYTLIISLPSEKRIEIGKMGIQRFLRGYYAYTGSALGNGALGLEGRISRHLRKSKRKRWHIDFLLADEGVKVISALIASANERMECEINKYLQKGMQAQFPISNFGSSDCKEGCGSHLLYLGCDENVVKRVAELYRERAGEKFHYSGIRKI